MAQALDVERVEAVLAANPCYDYFGVRWDDKRYAQCAVPRRSRVWNDGAPTRKRLDGTSAVRVIPGRVAAQLARMRYERGLYLGKYVLVLGAHHVSYGEDPGEIVMRDPRVLDTWSA